MELLLLLLNFPLPGRPPALLELKSVPIPDLLGLLLLKPPFILLELKPVPIPILPELKLVLINLL